jgi:hypothetical protein
MEGELGEWSRKCLPVDVSHNQLKKRTQRGFRLALLQPVEDWSNMLSKLVRGGGVGSERRNTSPEYTPDEVSGPSGKVRPSGSDCFGFKSARDAFSELKVD